ncbi:hypothetical protein [Vibrio cholerae]|uniref:hypothetical protein n=1 Tax=Vibrio cholerae TaxID=666 RepID=UPI001E458EC8|nr:hypothetical protein [Vibrio cholerae]
MFKNSSYFSFICLVGCFQFFDFFVAVFFGFLFLFLSFGLVYFPFFYFVLIGFYLFGVDLLSWFGWWQVFLFCDFIE